MREAKVKQMMKEAKQEYESLKMQLPEVEKQLASLPKEQAEILKKQFEVAMKMMTYLFEYPSANLKVYTNNKQIIDEAIAYFESQ